MNIRSTILVKKPCWYELSRKKYENAKKMKKQSYPGNRRRKENADND